MSKDMSLFHIGMSNEDFFLFQNIITYVMHLEQSYPCHEFEDRLQDKGKLVFALDFCTNNINLVFLDSFVVPDREMNG